MYGSSVSGVRIGLHIDALIGRVSRLPDPSADLRAELQQMPLEEKQQLLLELDPDYYHKVDLQNPVRLQRALEVCITAGRPYSQLLVEQRPTPPPFNYEVRVLSMEPSELRNRINRRVDQMVADGLVDEVASLLPYRNLPTLRTVGYREIFPVIDGTESLDTAIAQIKMNTWHYARKQLTWLRRYDATVV